MKSVLNRGSVVQSLLGYDKGDIYVIKEANKSFAFVINGSNKTLNNPKTKNKKHLKTLDGYYSFENKNENQINFEVHNLVKYYKV